ncbi:hypothetical protein O7598_11910 [Micromonospora sp. WMMC241]|uniref:hypothetical protein n=1 Tax=Micromonospora sp. WMMC241 TaxID=3015159 RepID=UPI0022B6DBCF|nr:hypothetical protein [Micromonospora sp. WMMC241]MCZ7437101.1 hypothetical protein [Micromonospora sp. WMMC241]
MSGEPERSGARSTPDAPVDGWRGRWTARARTLGDAARSRTRRFWAGAQPTLRQLWWTEEPATPVTTVDRRFPEPLVVPAQGQVYVFLVRTTFTWSSDTARPELFGWYVDYFQPQATQRLHRLALRCAVEVPPHRPRELLTALAAALAADDPPPWTYARGEVTFACEPDVTVQLDERVRRLLQPYWEQRIALECERDLARRRAEYAHERDRATPPRPHPPRPDPPRPDPAIPVRPPRDSTRPASPRRGPRPNAPAESFTPLEPLLPPPTPRPAPDQNPPPPPAR